MGMARIEELTNEKHISKRQMISIDVEFKFSKIAIIREAGYLARSTMRPSCQGGWYA